MNTKFLKACGYNTSTYTNTNCLMKKIISTLIIITILSGYTTPFSIAGNEEEQEEVEITQEIVKYIPYMYSEETQGVILQEKVKVNTKMENIQQTVLQITIPKYCDITPETIEIITKNELIGQNTENSKYYSVNEEKTEIKLIEKSDFGAEYYITYYYPKTAYDKYLDTTHVKEYPDGEIVEIKPDEETGEIYVYIDFAWDEEENTGEKPDSKILMDKISIQLKSKVEVWREGTSVIKEQDNQIELILQIGDLIDINTKVDIEKISKGEIYAKKELNYELINTVNILKNNVIENAIIENLNSKFIDSEENESNMKEKYNSFVITKKNFTNIFGEAGNITILDENSEELTKINSETEVDENGNIIFELTEEKQIKKIELNGIVNNGFLEVKLNKTIISNQEYTKEEIMKFKQAKLSVELKKIEGYTQKIVKNVEIFLKESYTKAKFNINNSNLSTIGENTGVEFKIELMNNNTDTDLWEDALIIIELPEKVEKISINSANMVLGEGLELHSYTTGNLNGKNIIKLQLTGKQQDFISNIVEGGTTIVVNANILLKELTLTSQDNPVNLYYFNANKTNYENNKDIEFEGQNYNVGVSSLVINYVAPVGFTTIQQISGYSEEGKIVNSINSENELGKIKILEPEKTADYKIILMNNTGNKVTNAKVMGNIAYIGNKNIKTGEELGTTVNSSITKLVTPEDEKKYKIYYTENENADSDIEKVENGWTLTPENNEKIKLYLIIIEEIAQGEKIYFDYSLKIPANLEHGENLYNSVCTYYSNNTEVGNVIESSNANIVGLTTGIGARAKIELSCGIDTGAMFTEGQKVKYKIKVQNTGELIAENVLVRNPIPQGTSYIEETVVKNEIETYNKYTYYSSENELIWKIGSLEPSKIVELEYTVVINNMPSILEYYGMQEGFTEENGSYYIVSKDEVAEGNIKSEITDLPDIVISNIATLESTSIEKAIQSNEVRNSVVKSYFDILEECSVEKAVLIEEKQEYAYTVIIENKTDLKMKKLNIIKEIPEGVTYKSADILKGKGNVKFDWSSKVLNITSEEFEKNGLMEIKIIVIANTLEDDVYKKEITTNTQVSAEGIEENTSSSVINTIGRPKLISKIECDVKQRYIYKNDMLNYTITLKNENDVTASNLTITNIIPNGTKFVTGSYIQNGKEYTILSDGSKNIELNTNLTNEELILKIKVQVEKINSNISELEIINKANYKTNTIEETEIGQIKHTIINLDVDEGAGKPTPGGTVGEDGIIRYKIKGSIWYDINKDGERQDAEETIKGIKVYLLKPNGDIVKDYKTGEEKIAISNDKGEYEFTNIEKGKYMVSFVYDTNTYNITEYQKTGIVNDRNSDAILKTIYINGNSQEAGVTDLIEITNYDMYSIDLGLTLKAKFNLKLEAGINSVTVTSKNSTKKTDYNMSDLAKVEIKSSLINGATVIIEYNIKITNNSDLSGSVLQLMANKPNGVSFASNMNNNWYEGNDNNLYISELSNKIINPGESTNVKLILVKQMTNNNNGKIENSFTITKTYNEKGQEETNLEDNIKTVNCLILSSTGAVTTYTGIAIAFIVLIIIGIIIIKKIVNIEKR